MQIKGKVLPGEDRPAVSWEQYYKETEPDARLRILTACREQDPGEEKETAAALFAVRYEKNRRGEYADTFLRAWTELLLLARSGGEAGMPGKTGLRFSRKKLNKELEHLYKDFALDRTDRFSEELLGAELLHMVVVYALISTNDRSYSRVLFGFGRIRDDVLRKKILHDYHDVSGFLARMGQQERFALLLSAIARAEEDYL